MVEHIEDQLFSGPYEIINKWDQSKCIFRETAATLRAHYISKMNAQTKKAIKNEVNSLLLGGGSNKRRITCEQKVLRAIRLGYLEDGKSQKTLYLSSFGRL